MRIVYSYGGRENVFERDTQQVIIGRPKHGVVIDLDLSPDQTVSRPHARVWVEEDGHHWIEDLNSAGGTQVSGEEIRGKGRRRLHPGESLLLGDTGLRVEFAAVPESTVGEPRAEPASTTVPPDITQRLDAESTVFSPADNATADTARRLAMLYELPLQFGAVGQLEALLQTIVERAVAVIPRAMRGALLVKDRLTGDLLLKAHVPTGGPAVSTSLAQQAMDQRQGFAWRRSDDVTITQSEHHMESGMYAPLLWKGEALGVVCVDNSETASAFETDDLKLMLAIAQHAAMAVVHHVLQEDLRRNASLTARLLANFSPKVQGRLLEQARRGRLRLGGEKSSVSILVSDIRGFTEMSTDMDAEEVVDILNAYFPPLVDAVFAYDGTIDKFLGDAILAVFGSPEADPQHHEKAVRAAVAMQAAARGLTADRAARGQVVCDIGIGVHCGEVFHGFIGSNERLEYTVIGDAVNRAKRYCDGAGPGEVVVSPELHQWIWNLVQSEPVAIQTKHEGDWPALRVKGLRGDARRKPVGGR